MGGWVGRRPLQAPPIINFIFYLYSTTTTISDLQENMLAKGIWYCWDFSSSIHPSTHPPIHPSILTTHTPNRHTQTHRHTDTQTHTASMRTQDKEDCTGGGGSSSRQSSGLLVCDHVVGSEESSRRRRDRTATGGRRYCHRCRGGSVMTLCGRRRFCCGTCDRLGSRWRSSAAHPRSGCCFVA